MTIRTSTLAGGGGAGFRLAPDLTWPTDVITSSSPYKRITLTLTPATYNTALSLTGKFAVGFISFIFLPEGEQTDIRLTVDGVVIWDGGALVNSTLQYNLLGNINNFRQYITCNSSLLLEIQTATDTSCAIEHDARPIL
jgi:hypothetical protein